MDNTNNTNFGMQAFEQQINLELLHDIVSFIMDATGKKIVTEHIQNSLLFDKTFLSNTNVQEKYGFRYLGELLERFDDHFGTDIRNTRAVALALALAYDRVTDDMFVGSQKTDYINKATELSKRDIYLKGAVYLIQSFDGTEADTYKEFLDATYTKTENIIFALSLFDDFDKHFQTFRAQLSRLLSKDRNMPVFDNERVYGWLVHKLLPINKGLKGKEASLFKALTALPNSFVKDGKPQYTTLINNGYSRKEIVYLNYALVHFHFVKDALSETSIVGEKIVVEFFREYLNAAETHTDSEYAMLESQYQTHFKFNIKCYGSVGILEAVENNIHLVNADTFAFLFSTVRDRNIHRSLFMFDIRDAKWDSLVSKIDREDYIHLFNNWLLENPDITKGEIWECISKFESLTGSEYLSLLKNEDAYIWQNIFSLFVNKEIIDLTQLYVSSIERTGSKAVFYSIWSFIKGVSSRAAYEFVKYLFNNYSLKEIVDSFDGAFNLVDGFFLRETHYSYYYRYNQPDTLTIERSFLTEEENRLLFRWIDDYMFEFKIDKYIEFVKSALNSDFIEMLFTKPVLRKLFDTVMDISAVNLSDSIKNYKDRFFTEEELQKEQEKEKLERQRQEIEQALSQRLAMSNELLSSLNEGFSGVHKLLESYKWRYRETNILCDILSGKLDEIFSQMSYSLNSKELSKLFQVFGILLQEGTISLPEAQNYILKVQEVVDIAENN